MTLDALVVLGGGILQNGDLPLHAKKRVEMAANLYLQGTAQILITSSKHSFSVSFVPPKTEAKAMADYAQSLGVPQEQIFLEEESMNTLGNAYFSKTHYLEPNGWKNVGVLTSKFHIPRSKYIFNTVLGGQYDIQYFESENATPQPQLLVRGAIERFLLWQLKASRPRLSDDNEAVRQFLSNHHSQSDAPFYRAVRRTVQGLSIPGYHNKG